MRRGGVGKLVFIAMANRRTKQRCGGRGEETCSCPAYADIKTRAAASTSSRTVRVHEEGAVLGLVARLVHGGVGRRPHPVWAPHASHEGRGLVEAVAAHRVHGRVRLGQLKSRSEALPWRRKLLLLLLRRRLLLLHGLQLQLLLRQLRAGVGDLLLLLRRDEGLGCEAGPGHGGAAVLRGRGLLLLLGGARSGIEQATRAEEVFVPSATDL